MNSIKQIYRNTLIREIRNNRNLRYILRAQCTAIGDEVVYTDSVGKEKGVAAGTEIIATGMKRRLDEAMALWNTVERFIMIGNCSEVGNVEKAMRTAFSAAIVL